MTIEEITLSVPDEPDRLGDTRSPADATAQSVERQSATFERFVSKFVKTTRARDRFVFTERGRQRRYERYDLALKTLVKNMATEASRTIQDRSMRLDLRSRIYATTMVLVKATSRDHLTGVRRGRKMLCWGLALASLGLAGFVFTLTANGWIMAPVG